jgi:hypothetical protein
MNEKLYKLHELLDGTLQKGMTAEAVNLGEENFKVWFNPETCVLEYKDYPDQPLEIVCVDHPDFPVSNDDSGAVLFRITE